MEVKEPDVRAALQDPGSARVLQACISAAHSANQISEFTGIPVVTVYRHVKRLTKLGLLFIERGALTSTGKPYDLYRSRIEWAILAISGDELKVQWKMHRAMSDRLHGLWKQLEERK